MKAKNDEGAGQFSFHSGGNYFLFTFPLCSDLECKEP